MGCTNCGSGDDNGRTGGCSSGSCSTGGGGCATTDVHDWLSNMQLPSGKSEFDIVEIRFKHNRKSFFRNLKGLPLKAGDTVVVEANPGHDVGVISVTGELSRIQLKRKDPNFKVHEARKVLRHASQDDIDKWVEAYKKENNTMIRARQMTKELSLEMKISDVEYQADGSKATFYYTANGRVDFRQLIKNLASEFRLRIEMRQIGARQEAARLGGISSSGRELCSSTWLTDLRSVSTTAARYQQLSLNPQKLAGQCGKLKCCLNFELDSYIEALKDFPSTNIKLKTKKGTGIHIKTDVFKNLMWYLHQTEEREPNLIALTPARVKEIIALNKKGDIPEDLKDFEEIEIPNVDEKGYSNVIGQDDLNRFDKNFTKNKKKKKRRNKKPKAKGNQSRAPKQENKGPKPQSKDAKDKPAKRVSNKKKSSKPKEDNTKGAKDSKASNKRKAPKRKPNNPKKKGSDSAKNTNSEKQKKDNEKN